MLSIIKNNQVIYKTIYYCLIFLCTIACFSCVDKDEQLSTHEKLLLDDWILSEDGESYYRFPTEEELIKLEEDGFTLANPEYIDPNVAVTRAQSCSWSDGVGGTINCDGGTCRVVWQIVGFTVVGGSTPSQVTTCISCSTTNQIGLCR